MESVSYPHSYDDKYVVMKAADFWMLVGYLNDGQRHEHEVEVEANVPIIRDAVVIRRQDYFASPALASYAASIALAIKTADDPDLQKRLMKVADYFQQQSELAAEEGFKFPGD